MPCWRQGLWQKRLAGQQLRVLTEPARPRAREIFADGPQAPEARGPGKGPRRARSVALAGLGIAEGGGAQTRSAEAVTEKISWQEPGARGCAAEGAWPDLLFPHSARGASCSARRCG